MNRMLGNSSMPTYIKLCATGILALTYIAALSIAVRDYMVTQPIPSEISFILGTGMSLAVGALGMHQGAQFTETQTAQQKEIDNASASAS